MRRSGIAFALLGSVLAWGLVAPPAEANVPAIEVAVPEDWQGETSLQVWVRTEALVGAGDLILTQYQKQAWPAFHVYIDPDSGSSMTLAAGGNCSLGVPAGFAPLPQGTSVICTYITRYSRIAVNLSASTYAGGDFTVTNMLDIPASFRGSEFADYFQGGGGADSFSGGGGNDAIFGGEGQDWIVGGDGADRLDGEGAGDVVFGDLGADDITADDDKRARDYINCNNMDAAAANTDNDPDNPPVNTVSYDAGIDNIVDCGMPGAPTVAEAPLVTGVPRVGHPSAASSGTWTGKALVISHTWFSCPAPDDTVPAFDDAPEGACTEVFARDDDPGLAYTPKPSDEGRYLKLRSIARNNSGTAGVVSPPSEPVAAPSAKPGPVRDLTVTVTRKKGPNRNRPVTVTVTWMPPIDKASGVKDYVIEIAGMDLSPVTTTKTSYETTWTTYPRGQAITVKVAARGRGSQAQQGPWAEKSVTLPRR